jgi:Tol biopolymer transport system component
MQRNKYPVIALVVLILSALACSLPGNTSGQPAPDEVATIVAATMQALTPAAAMAGTPTTTPAGILPRPLYFVNNDSVGISQVFRLETDGATLHQVTFEPAVVNSYDVSQVDGSVVYVSNNQLLLINADGSGRRLLVDGGPLDPNSFYASGLSNPIFSPNGQTIAYNNKGLVLYSLASGVENRVLSNHAIDPATGVEVVREVYIPEKYSPDGSKILLTVAIPNSDGIGGGIYYIAPNTLTRLSSEAGFSVCCGQPNWSMDGSALFTASASVGMFNSGLWRIDSVSGSTTTLMPAEAGGGNYNLAEEPFLAPNGQLYFFYTTAAMEAQGFIDNAPLQIVRASPDGVNGRTVLRPETFETLNEALWSPDASFVITAKAPAPDVYQGGIIELYYTDAQKSVIQLSQFGSMLKWGP